MKYIPKVLRSGIEQEAHGHLSRSALNFSSGAKLLLPEKGNSDPVPKNPEEYRPESEESEWVEAWLAFEMKNSALYYFYAFRNYQQTRAPKHATQTSLLQIVIQFGRSGASCRCFRTAKTTEASWGLPQSTQGEQTQRAIARVSLRRNYRAVVLRTVPESRRCWGRSISR